MSIARPTVLLLAMTLLVGCDPQPGPYLSCGDVSTVLCEAAHAEALEHGLFLDPGEEPVAALVLPTEARICDGVFEPRFDVIFELRGRTAPITVTVAEARDGSLIVCTY